MQRYFVKEKNNDKFIFYEKDLHHIRNVMRGKINDHIEIVYLGKIYLCNIDNIDPLDISIINVIDEECNTGVKLTIAVGLVQEQKFDLILQKLTELGVYKIIPLKMERSIVKLDQEKIEKKQKRWQTICKEASEQSHRTNIPEITNVMSLRELSNYKCNTKLICSLSKVAEPLSNHLSNYHEEILFVIGPEGGISNEEEIQLENDGFVPVSLGKRVMRVETATFYVASVINYVYGR